MTYRNANHRSSTVDAQLDTMMSPAPGLHRSDAFAPRLRACIMPVSESSVLMIQMAHPLLRVTVSTCIQGSPSISSTVRAMSVVNICDTALYNGGTGFWFREQEWAW